MITKSLLVISDMHHPYAHRDTVSFLAALKKKYNFDMVVCIGDEIDNHAISFHDSDPDLDSPGVELSKAIDGLKPLYKLFPKVTVVESNHGSLVYRKALASGLPKAVLKSYNEILRAPKGWKWTFDVKVKTELGPIYLCHGKSGASGRMASSYGCSVIQGHYHEKAQITYISTPERLMFDAHTGCLADDKSLALGYNKINPKRPIVSVIIVINGIPQLIPMVLNSKARWVGKL
jgi:predicted phosphodiesterase